MSKIEKWESELDKVNAMLKEETELRERQHRVSVAHEKIRAKLVSSLTQEERQAVAGMYLFLHISQGVLCVDFVNGRPSPTDKGQSERLEKALEAANAESE